MTPERQPLEPSNLSKKAIYQLAENVAQQLKYEPGSDVGDALKALGGRLNLQGIWRRRREHSGSLVVSGPGNFDVYIATNTSPTRDRFTIAHEIGHYVLHFLWQRHQRKPIERIEATRYGSDRAEWEANWFAAAFLMPEAAFQERLRQTQRGYLSRGAGLQISPMAAKIRAKALNLISS